MDPLDRDPLERDLRDLLTDDQQAALRQDVQRVRSWPYLDNLAVGGFLYDLDTGWLHRVC